MQQSLDVRSDNDISTAREDVQNGGLPLASPTITENTRIPEILFEIEPIIHRAIGRLSSWLTLHVKGLAIERGDLDAYALHLALTLLGKMSCPCGCRICPEQHTLTAQPGSGKDLTAFIYRAVIGPAGLKTNSIAQGMLFPHLREDYGMRRAVVAVKECAQPTCRAHYEGATCLRCHTSFLPRTTAIHSKERLVVEGENGYLPVGYWRCGRGTAKHFYLQDLCRSRYESEETDGSERVLHSVTHDRCPWHGCLEGNPLHGQRGTTLWVRAKFLHLPQEHRWRPSLLHGVVAGMQLMMLQSTSWERALLRVLGDNEVAIAEALFVDEAKLFSTAALSQALAAYADAPPPQHLHDALSQHIRPKVQQAIRQVFLQQGIDPVTMNDCCLLP